ncbi:MAG: U32 family peptidase [Peptostreptococcaceae bacterium]|nr:U32 family peptidase [Peptostreptococcaceae bacterium]
MRTFNNKKIELLAPAGNFEIFSGIIDSKCDAIYFGGQRMNMRMIRTGYNFTDEELKEAVLMANEKGKATYITVNNLLDSEEAESVKEYLHYLSEIKATGIIIQDFATLSSANAMKLNMEIHASVMMNVHNLEMIKALEKHGVSRVVLPREATLAEASYFHSNSNMELEYFTHGDMCVAHGGQCYYSSMLFGMSSNRGKCLKPCRWGFEGEGNQSYPLAVKDMSMIGNLPEMIQAGITSFKIEGRMREKDFIVNLINQYGEVLDHYMEDPVGYSFKTQEEWIYEHRKRDLSTAYAFGNPGMSNINTRYEGTGKFYSTGKMFSTSTQECPVDSTQIATLKTIFSDKNSTPVKLSVRVEDMAQAKLSIEEGVDRIYLASDVFQPKRPFTIPEIKRLAEIKGSTELFLSTPRMMDAVQFDRYRQWFTNLLGAPGIPGGSKKKHGIDGLLVTNLGAIEAFKEYGLKMVGDYSLNIFNKHAARFFINEGLSEITPSIELPGRELHKLLKENIPFEVITHGRLTSMYMAYDLYTAHGVDLCEQLIFENEAGQYLIKRDVFGKSHLIMQKHYTLLPVAGRLNQASVRIEAQMETVGTLRWIIRAHKQSIAGDVGVLKQLNAQLRGTEYTFGATRF